MSRELSRENSATQPLIRRTPSATTSHNNGFPVALSQHSVSQSAALDGKPGHITVQTHYQLHKLNMLFSTDNIVL